MHCPHCEESLGKEVEMTLTESQEDYYDPRESHGHGQTLRRVWICPRCRYAEPYDAGDDEPDGVGTDC